MFHVSRIDLGHIVTLTPRVPKSAAAYECSLTPRVCFAPTVEQCVGALMGIGEIPGPLIIAAALEFSISMACPTVYYCDQDLIKPDPVGDYPVTQEHWSLAPVTVERIGYLDYVDMVKRRCVDIVENPRHHDIAAKELVNHICKKDRQALLDALAEETQ